MNNNETNKIIEQVSLLGREKIEVTGVVEVLSSTDKDVLAKLEKDYIQISGSGLTIAKLMPDEKLLEVTGQIACFQYISKLNKKSFFGKVFK